MFLGGFLVDFFGKIRMISIYLLAFILLISSMSFLNVYWQSKIFMIGFIISYSILITFTTIAIFASTMQLCWKRVAATQFTLYMAISNLGFSLGAALIGPLKNYLKWEHVILFYVVFAIAMLILIQFINFEKHQKLVDELEAKYSEKTHW